MVVYLIRSIPASYLEGKLKQLWGTIIVTGVSLSSGHWEWLLVTGDCVRFWPCWLQKGAIETKMGYPHSMSS